MMPLPVAAPATPNPTPGADADGASTSGDFAALLALVAGTSPAVIPIENPAPEGGGSAPEPVQPLPAPAAQIAPPPAAGSPLRASPVEIAPPEGLPVETGPVDAPPAPGSDVAGPVGPGPGQSPPLEAAATAAPPVASPPPGPPAGGRRIEETAGRPPVNGSGPDRVAALVSPGPHDDPRAQVTVPSVAIAASPALVAAAPEATADGPEATAPGPAVPAPGRAGGATPHDGFPAPPGSAETSPAGTVSAKPAPKAVPPQARPLPEADSPVSPAAASYAPAPSGAAPLPPADHVSERSVPARDERGMAVAPGLQPPVRAEAAGRPEFPVAASPVSAPAVPEQVVSAVVPLHGRGDGRHEVTLELRPGHLGAIRVEVTVEQQTVHVTLHAADPATGRLLAAALPDLRSALAEAGVTAGFVGVGPDAGGGTGAGRSRASTETRDRRASGAGRRPGEPEAPGSVPTIRPAMTGRLDLFL